MQKRNLLTTVFVLCVFVFPALAQQPADTTALAPQPPLPPDTFPFFYSFPNNHEYAFPADDTLPDNDFRMYDPARRQAIDWGTLGNVGSSARPLFFQPHEQLGFHTGHHAFDLYQLRLVPYHNLD